MSVAVELAGDKCISEFAVRRQDKGLLSNGRCKPGACIACAICRPADPGGRVIAGVDAGKLTGAGSVHIALEGNNSFSTQFGEVVTPSLYIACREGKKNYIDCGTYPGLEESTMIHRNDKQKGKNKFWPISTDTNAVFNRGNVVSFIKNLSSGSVLFAQIVPYNENSVSSTFSLDGLSEAIKPLQETCGWR